VTRPPYVAASVHYVEPGRLGGPPECQAAVVTGVLADDGLANLTVFGEERTTYVHAALPDENSGRGRSCGWCGGEGVGYPEDTWHWPVVPGDDGPR
jgi:hypothetical protein